MASWWFEGNGQPTRLKFWERILYIYSDCLDKSPKWTRVLLLRGIYTESGGVEGNEQADERAKEWVMKGQWGSEPSIATPAGIRQPTLSSDENLT